MCLPFSYSGNASLNPYSVWVFTVLFSPLLYIILITFIQHSFQTPIDLSLAFLISKVSLYSSPVLYFSHFSLQVNSFLKHRLKMHRFNWVLIMFFQDQTHYELSFFTSTEVYSLLDYIHFHASPSAQCSAL